MPKYSPRIRDDLIPALYKLGKQEQKPMTKVVDQIVRDALKDKGLINQPKK